MPEARTEPVFSRLSAEVVAESVALKSPVTMVPALNMDWEPRTEPATRVESWVVVISPSSMVSAVKVKPREVPALRTEPEAITEFLVRVESMEVVTGPS